MLGLPTYVKAPFPFLRQNKYAAQTIWNDMLVSQTFDRAAIDAFPNGCAAAFSVPPSCLSQDIPHFVRLTVQHGQHIHVPKRQLFRKQPHVEACNLRLLEPGSWQ